MSLSHNFDLVTVTVMLVEVLLCHRPCAKHHPENSSPNLCDHPMTDHPLPPLLDGERESWRGWFPNVLELTHLSWGQNPQYLGLALAPNP